MSENDNEAFEIAASHLQEDSTCFLPLLDGGMPRL